MTPPDKQQDFRWHGIYKAMRATVAAQSSHEDAASLFDRFDPTVEVRTAIQKDAFEYGDSDTSGVFTSACHWIHEHPEVWQEWPDEVYA